MKKLKIFIIFLFFNFLLTSCILKELPGADARKVPTDPNERVKRNIEEGRGFRLMDEIGKKSNTNFEFASSNELWRATLDTIDFMPLATANYSGGILITDWYSDNSNNNESIKISVRFLTNEVRSDALDLKVFYKKCKQANSCTTREQNGSLVNELKKEILKKAAIYKNQSKDKNKRPYKGTFDSTTAQ
tara:strand:+ start:53 stop:619 length:567 start_codon:yes stop_codon:yes gene_type:complete